MEIVVQHKWVNSVNELESCLGPMLDCFTCQGRPRTKSTCKNPISQASLSQIRPVLDDIVKSRGFSRAAEHLERLASLVLCRRWHYDQVADIVAGWRCRLCSFLGCEGSFVKKEAEHDDDDHELACRKLPLLRTTKKITLRNSSSSQSSGAPKPKTKSEKDNSPHDVVKKEEHGESSRLELVPALKRSTPNTVDCKKQIQVPKTHDFTPYGPTKHLSKINNEIVLKLGLLFEPQERKTDKIGAGYIYGYKLPKHETTTGGNGDQMIKIGFTNNPDRRMREWWAQCGYEPQVVFAYRLAHYVKLEKIIHLQLGNERRKVVRCPGCRKTHREFFEVDERSARDVVKMWAAWARLTPFDEEGRLTQYWRRKLEEVDVKDPDCWEKFVFDRVV